MKIRKKICCIVVVLLTLLYSNCAENSNNNFSKQSIELSNINNNELDTNTVRAIILIADYLFKDSEEIIDISYRDENLIWITVAQDDTSIGCFVEIPNYDGDFTSTYVEKFNERAKLYTSEYEEGFLYLFDDRIKGVTCFNVVDFIIIIKFMLKYDVLALNKSGNIIKIETKKWVLYRGCETCFEIYDTNIYKIHYIDYDCYLVANKKE